MAPPPPADSDNPYPFNMKGDYKVTVKHDRLQNFLFLEGSIDVQELVIETGKNSYFKFKVGGDVGREGDEIDAFSPTIKADRLAMIGGSSQVLSVRSAAVVDVGNIEVPSLEQSGGTITAREIKVDDLRVDSSYVSDWTPASQLSLEAESIEAENVEIDGTSGGNNAEVYFDIGTLTVGGPDPELILTNTPAGIERLVISGTKPGYLAPVRLEGKNSLNEVVIQSDAAFYQRSANGAYKQCEASLSIINSLSK